MKSPECSNCEQWAMHSANSERPTIYIRMNDYIYKNELIIIIIIIIIIGRHIAMIQDKTK